MIAPYLTRSAWSDQRLLAWATVLARDDGVERISRIASDWSRLLQRGEHENLVLPFFRRYSMNLVSSLNSLEQTAQAVEVVEIIFQ
jgi:hypothetical protein